MDVLPTKSIIVLDPKYYLKYFRDFLATVERLYANLLADDERTYIEDFLRLSEDAQCLYVRMATRQGIFFKTTSLHYVELATPLEKIIAELANRGWARDVHADEKDFARIFDLFTKDEWIAALSSTKAILSPRSLTKSALIERALAIRSPAEILAALLADKIVVRRLRDDILARYKFLYFGHVTADFSAFILRDIGRSRYEERPAENIVPRFSSRAVFDEAFSVAKAYDNFKELASQSDPLVLLGDFEAWRSEVGERIESLGAESRRTFERWALKLAAVLEKHDHKSEALRIYRFTSFPPARERQIRLLTKLGRTAEAHDLCIVLANDPAADTSERAFALDQLSRAANRRARRSTTEKLKQADTIVIDEYDSSPEAAAIAHYAKLGYTAHFTENWLWNSLFGIIFWPLIHSGESRYHFPLQITPSQLRDPNFFVERLVEIDAILERLCDRDEFLRTVNAICESKFGTVNAFVNWSATLARDLISLYDLVGWKKLRAVMRGIAYQPVDRGKGFPDLLVQNEREYFFVEVKSHRDKLSNYQVRWLDFFEKTAIPARILKFQKGA